ncbi:GTP-binding protein, partial [Campylobacter sp. LH-2024]
PKPFTTLIYRLSEPLDISNLDKDEAKKKLLACFKHIEELDSFKE